MPPRKKSKPAKYEDDDFLDDDDPEVDDEDFVEDDDEDDEPVKKRKPAKKKAAPKKETPAKKPKKEDDRIMTPHVALEGPQWDLVPPSLLYRCCMDQSRCHGMCRNMRLQILASVSPCCPNGGASISTGKHRPHHPRRSRPLTL